MAWNPADVDYFTLIGNIINECIIYPRCMDDQYSYYEETAQESESGNITEKIQKVLNVNFKRRKISHCPIFFPLFFIHGLKKNILYG